jgi:hypothetical protein
MLLLSVVQIIEVAYYTCFSVICGERAILLKIA